MRNLTGEEIVGQILLARDRLGDYPDGARRGARGRDGRLVSNIVMMGMGEPLYNFDNVSRRWRSPPTATASPCRSRRITLSTSGVVPMIPRAGEEIGVMLAISLHAARDELRDVLVPLNKKYPIAELLDACRAYPGLSNARRITFEYVMLKGVNDSPADARDLVRLLAGIPAKINLIPFNPWPGRAYECSDWDADRALRRRRQPRRLRLADPHAARPRHPGRLRATEERERAAAHPRAAGAGGDDRSVTGHTKTQAFGLIPAFPVPVTIPAWT